MVIIVGMWIYGGGGCGRDENDGSIDEVDSDVDDDDGDDW